MHAVCMAATRNISIRFSPSDYSGKSTGEAPVEASFAGRGSPLVNTAGSRGRQSVGSGMHPMRVGFGAEENGATAADLAWLRYSHVVKEVVSTWCRDPGTFDLDPLWLLPKLRAYQNW